MSKVGFVLSHEQFAAPQLLEFGASAEQAGFDMVWTSDHFHPWMDNQGNAGHAWVTLAALGQRTQRIPFGTGVTCPTYRYHPTTVAHGFASLGVLNPGRVFLGVGSGEALNEQAATGEWGKFKERNERLAESVELIRKLWTGEWVNHKGDYYRVKNARIYNLPTQPIPIYIAASGEESTITAGKHGDGLITDPKTLKKPETLKAFHEGAREAKRDIPNPEVLVEHFVVLGGKAEAEEAAKLWRFLPKAWSEYVDNPDPRDIERRAEKSVKLEDVYGQWLVSEDPQAHADGIAELFAAGATQIFVHAGNHDQGRVIDFYRSDVLPRLREQRERAV